MTPRQMTRYLDILERRGCAQLFGYPSAIHQLCLHAQREGRDLRQLGVRVAFVTGEVLLAEQREVIGRTFRCQVADGYGGRDSGFIAHECPGGSLHVMSDAVVVEILDEAGRPAPQGAPGEIVVTDLFSEEAPFIRYATGDVGVAGSGACSCGRPFEWLARVEGRLNDLVTAPDGRAINSLALIYPLREIAGIAQYQIQQKAVDWFHVRICREPNYSEGAEDVIRRSWTRLLRCPVRVSFEYPERLPAERSGKFRHVTSDLRESTGRPLATGSA
jgi:phenylacetate-CoA ligase